MEWWTKGSALLCGKTTLHDQLEDGSKVKVAGFDLDFTLIKRKSNKIFPCDHDDWEWCSGQMREKIRHLNDEGYIIVIISNQNNMSLEGGRRGDIFKFQILQIASELCIPLRVYASVRQDMYRKPRTWMWSQFLSDINKQETDLADCFYVGDAAGRFSDWACSDRKFACNLKIPFFTPEELLHKSSPEPYTLGRFDPNGYLFGSAQLCPEISHLAQLRSSEIVLLFGAPSCGKTTFFQSFLRPLGYLHGSMDCLETLITSIESSQQSIVIEHSEYSAASRQMLFDVAGNARFTLRCIYLQWPYELAWHNKNVKILHFGGEDGLVLDSEEDGLLQWYREVEEPKLNEGFHEIIVPQFQFVGEPDYWQVWRQYWG